MNNKSIDERLTALALAINPMGKKRWRQEVTLCELFGVSPSLVRTWRNETARMSGPAGALLIEKEREHGLCNS